MNLNKLHPIIASALFFCVCFIFWGEIHPEALSLQEQQQLFLFSTDYFWLRIGVAGGLADYVSEFVTQFYYYPTLGALLLSGVLLALQLTCWRIAKLHTENQFSSALSFVPAVLMWGYMGDENVLLSLPVALIGVLIATLGVLKCNKLQLPICIVALPLLYWLAGPTMIISSIIIAISIALKKRYLASVSIVAYTIVIFCVARTFFLTQYTLNEALFGINYYRICQFVPKMQHIVVLTIAFLPFIALLFSKIRNNKPLIAMYVLIVVGGATWINKNFDTDKYHIFKYNHLVRAEKWTEIIAYAEKYPLKHPMACNAVNLALGMTGQLGERMFSFPQCGSNALVSKFDRTSLTVLTSAEAFMRLGMVNEALRYFFDSQEAIPNCRKSGRMMRRMAECNIINGRYEVARKYLTVLKQSLFYSTWAKNAEQMLYNETAIDKHPVWGRIRQIRYNEDFVYNYYEMDKMFGILYQQNNSNHLAYQYFVGQQLLVRNLHDFIAYTPWILQQYGYVPQSYQQAIALAWSQGHSNWDNMPIEISSDVKTKLMDFAQIYSQNPNSKQLQQQYQNTYWYYCLVQKPNIDAQTGATQTITTHKK